MHPTNQPTQLNPSQIDMIEAYLPPASHVKAKAKLSNKGDNWLFASSAPHSSSCIISSRPIQIGDVVLLLLPLLVHRRPHHLKLGLLLQFLDIDFLLLDPFFEGRLRRFRAGERTCRTAQVEFFEGFELGFGKGVEAFGTEGDGGTGAGGEKL
jgi:hypothetical protein